MMRYRLLGPIEVLREDRPLSLGGAKQRALLADLLLHANHVVPSEQLLEDLWGNGPRSTGHELQVYVSRLRKLLREDSGDGRIVTQPPGYLLVLGPGDSLDIERFEVFREEGCGLLDAQPATALQRFDSALALWRGPAFGDLASAPFASPSAARLEDLRRSTLEDRLDAKLALGHHEEVAAEARALLAEGPLRERAWGLLMLALYRCGRQGEALQAHQEARQRLSDELGMDPGPELVKLHTAILQHDPTLALPPRLSEAPVDVPAPSVPPRRRRRQRAIALALIVAFALVAATGLVIAARHDAPPASTLALKPNMLASVDLASGRIEPVAPTGSDPIAVAISGTTAWVANIGDRTVSVIDLKARHEIGRIGGVGIPTGIAAGMGSVWVADTFGGTITQIDAETIQVVRQIHGVGAPTGLAVGLGAVWVADALGERIVRLDPETGAILDSVRPPDGWAPTNITVGEDAVWVTSGVSSLVARLDPSTMELVTDAIPVCCPPAALAAAGSAVWLVSDVNPHAVRIDAGTNAVRVSVRLGVSPRAVAVGDDGAWVADPGDGTLRLLDPSGQVIREIVLEFPPSGVVLDGSRLLVLLADA